MIYYYWQKINERRMFMKIKEFLKEITNKGIYLTFLNHGINKSYNYMLKKPNNFRKKILYILQNKKNKYMMNFIDSLFNQEEFNQIYNKNDELVNEHSKKYIFTLWWQGVANAPKIVQICINSILKNSGDFNVIILDKNNICNYVDDIDHHVLDLLNSNKISITNFSDYFRLKLLEKYDCIWLDSTIFVLKEIPKDYFNCEYISVTLDNTWGIKYRNYIFPRFPIGEVFFLSGTYKKYFSKCLFVFEKYYSKYDFAIDYFFIYYIMLYFYYNDSEIRKIIDKIPINNKHVADFIYYFDTKKTITIDDCDVFAKLTYKIDLESVLNDKNTFLHKLLSSYLD